MQFEPVKRQELIVWLYTLKHVKTLRQYGYIHYMSHQLKYVVLYVNADKSDTVIDELKKYHFVRKVEQSYRDEIDMTFKDAIPNRIDPDRRADESLSTSDQMSQFIMRLTEETSLTAQREGE